MQNENTKKQPAQGVKRFFFIYFAALILVLTFIGIMKWMGYLLISAGTEFFLFGVLLCSALAALTYFLSRRIHIGWLRVAEMVVGAVVTFCAAVLMVMVFTAVVEFSLPGHFNSYTDEAGNTAVVLREYNLDADRTAQRIADGQDAEEAEIGFSYAVYPRVMKFFYNSKAGGEGELVMGYASSGQLMYEWTDAGDFRLYIENANPGDSGEHTLKFE